MDYRYYNLNPTYALQGTSNHKLDYKKRDSVDPFYYNTNVLIQPKNSTSGDSGGPVFICKQSDNACSLLGVHSYSDAFVSGETLLLNPQYDMLRSN